MPVNITSSDIGLGAGISSTPISKSSVSEADSGIGAGSETDGLSILTGFGAGMSSIPDNIASSDTAGGGIIPSSPPKRVCSSKASSFSSSVISFSIGPAIG